MDDLISRKALLEEFRKRSDDPFELWDGYDIFKIIHNAPTIDAVEVVRCGECIERKLNSKTGLYKCDTCRYKCNDDDWFCPDGKRKENT